MKERNIDATVLHYHTYCLFYMQYIQITLKNSNIMCVSFQTIQKLSSRIDIWLKYMYACRLSWMYFCNKYFQPLIFYPIRCAKYCTTETLPFSALVEHLSWRRACRSRKNERTLMIETLKPWEVPISFNPQSYIVYSVSNIDCHAIYFYVVL